MAGPLLLAVDVGTGSVRSAVVDADGRIRALAAREHEQIVPRPGWSEQDPNAWWEGVAVTVRRAIAEAGARPGEIAAVGACGQMHGPVPVDADGRALLDRVQLWNDKRPAGLSEAFGRRPDADALAERAANPPAPSWIGFKVAWMRAHQPDVCARAAAFLTPKDFVNFRLTGAMATDHSEASGSFLYGWRARAYDPDLAAALGLDLSGVPPIRDAWEPIGAVTDGAAAETGLAAGTPVVAGAGDFLAALLGSGVVEPGVGSDVTGTSTLISVHAEAPILAPGVMNLHAAGPGWVPFTMIDAGGDSLRWARRAFDGPEVPFEAIEARAAGVAPGAEGLLFLPYLNGERLGGRPRARAQFAGLTHRHGRDHLYRAVLEGVALASRRNLARLRSAGVPIDRIVATGGGAAGELWPRIKADVYGVPILVPETVEGSVLGCALLAGAGAGVFPDLTAAARRLARVAREVRPDPAAVERYARLAEIFDDLYDAGTRLDDRLDGL